MEATKRSKQYCPTCKKKTMHTPKLGLVFENKRLCEVCRTVNEVDKKQLIIEIMNEDAKDGLYEKNTEVKK